MNHVVGFILGFILVVIVSAWYIRNGDDDAL